MHLELCTKDQFYEFLSEFDATQGSLESDINYLKEWLRMQPHLPNVEDDEWLENFLLRGKNSVERTKKLLEQYFTAKALLPDIFKNRDVYGKEFLEVMQYIVFVPVRKLTPDGHRVMIFRVLERRETIPPLNSLLKCMQIVFDASLKVDKVRGVTLIYDFENASTAGLSLINMELKKLMTVQYKINPIRYNKVYVLNLPAIAQPLFSIGLYLLKSKREKLVIWKKNSRELTEVIPKECLPAEYGGTDLPIPELRDMLYEDLKEYNDWLVEQETVKADLSLAPTQTKIDFSVTDSVEGTFRKLNID